VPPATPRSATPAPARVLLAILALVAVVALGAGAVHRQVRDGNDFPIYWQAARDLLAGRSPYDVGTGLHGYVYLPWFALAIVPLAFLPLPTAAACWVAANLLFVAFAVRELRRALAVAGPGAPHGPTWRLLALAALPLAGLAHDNLVLGQANLLLLALVAVVVRAGVAPATSPLQGAALGLAAALKMSAGLLALPLALRRRGRLLAVAALAVGVALVAPMPRGGVRAGVSLLREWHAKVVAPAAAGTLQGSKNIDQSPQAGLRRLLVDEPAFGGTHVNVAHLSTAAFARVSRVVSLALLAGYALLWGFAPRRGSPRDALLDLALGCCAMVQVTGFHLKAQFVVLLVPAWAAAACAFGPGVQAGAARRGTRALLLVAAALFLLSQPGLVGRAASDRLLAWSSLAVGTGLLAAALAWLRYAPLTPSPSDARSGAPGTGTAA